MIQRIQSIYLLLAAILMAVTVFSPFVQIQQSVVFLPNGLDFYTSDSPANLNYLLWIALAFGVLSTMFALISIFGYKNRKKQLKLCKLNSLVIILFYVVTGIYLFWLTQTINIELSAFKYGFILPFIALIFNILAASKIKADEKLVQSLNRIR